MNIIGILRQSSPDLLPEELDMLASELELGEYEADYVWVCKALIQEIRDKQSEKASSEKSD